jgi:AraC-like DNA-binding protein
MARAAKAAGIQHAIWSTLPDSRDRYPLDDDRMPSIASAGVRRGGSGPALARAAMEVAEGRLADPGLSPSWLAGELHVSVRTLHRAFAGAGEPVAAYIRRRRLEEARAELAVRGGRPGVSEVAARWQFADGSHFVRAFRKQYGQTPSQFARSVGTGP